MSATTKQNGIAKNSEEVNYINHEEDDEMEVYGYERNAVRTALTWLCVVLTAGTLRLVFHWYPQWLLYTTHTRCPLCSATKILVVENYLGKHKTYFVKDVQTISTNTANPNSVLSGPTEESAKQLNLALSQGVRVQLHNGASKDIQKVRSVRIKKLCYIWDEERSEFVKLAGLDKGLSKADFHQFSGYNEYQQLLRRSVYGPNDIPVQVQSLLTLLLLEVINPFYIFQLFTLCVWAAEGYIYYLIAIVLMTTFGVTSTILQTRRNQKSLHDTVHSSDVVTVWRGGDQYEDLPTTSLVPGDVIVIPPHGCDMHCDAVLLSGSCIVNESMLTGESVPVNKTSIPRLSGVPYDPKEDVNHTLFCGTKVIQTRFYGNERVCAVVLRTGFLTAKGSLVRSILYPPPADFKFDQDSYKFIGILAVIAAIGFVYTIVLKIHKEQSAGDIAIKALDLITIVIPPALPAALTVGKLYAQNRLQACKIFCINSRVINVAGSIDCVCFDKTGTLTEDGLDMNGALPVEDRQFHGIEHDVQQIKGSGLELGMAACHSLTLIDGALSGDPLDVKMFESTGWQLEEPDVADHDKYDLIIPTIVKSPGEAPTEIGLVHQFQFSSTLQRMSVVTRTLGSTDFMLYCKGSPEMIVSLSRPDTVPEDLPSTLQQYTEKGHRVIAIGRRVLEESSYTKIQRMRREDAEQDLEFLGMFVLENRLKMESQPVINVLKAARIKVVMITGDNVLTAISVAKECDIIEPGEIVVDVTAVPSVKDAPPRVFYTSAHGQIATLNGGGDVEAGIGHDRYKLALTGKSWEVIRENFPELVPRICTRGAIFARMSSDQKQQLVQELQGLGYYVAMCGDGANDCGALKAAHVGISLSEAESSVASPFTSKEANISCVPTVIREGRAALSTSSGIFRFMVAYSLTEFLSCIILYAVNSNLTDLQFLFIDICLIVNFAFFFGKTKAYTGPLVTDPPLTSLLSFIPVMSITLHMVMITIIQTAAFFTVRQFSWYPSYNKKNDDDYACDENFAVYSVSLFQYIASAIVFSQGKPYRKGIHTNIFLMVSLVVMTIICAYKTVYPAKWLLTFMNYKETPGFDFKIIVLCLAVINLVMTLFVESVFVNFVLAKVARPLWTKLTGLGGKERRFVIVDREAVSERWPPVCRDLPIKLNASFPELRTPVKTLDIQMKFCGTSNASRTNLGFSDEPL
ncbi:polyamine-transporting ATPase 13A3-like isoform X2 [Periplaneta americana]|uniref:polyamine-transporting ATPase 13A3-like isoform X2 n=1 Tax=Periplaneta americana TaxID=6978 RepID=UPI0037E8D8F8